MCGVLMTELCHPPILLQQAQALEHRAECRERAVTRLERKIERLVHQSRADQAARLWSAAHHVRQAAIRDRLHAAELRRAARR